MDSFSISMKIVFNNQFLFSFQCKEGQHMINNNHLIMLTLLLAHNVIESYDTLFCTRYHNQADDIVCTLTSAPITAKSISSFCLQREVENMRHALYQMAISFS